MLALLLLNNMTAKRKAARRVQAIKVEQRTPASRDTEAPCCRTCLNRNTDDLMAIFLDKESEMKRSRELKLVTGLKVRTVYYSRVVMYIASTTPILPVGVRYLSKTTYVLNGNGQLRFLKFLFCRITHGLLLISQLGQSVTGACDRSPAHQPAEVKVANSAIIL